VWALEVPLERPTDRGAAPVKALLLLALALVASWALVRAGQLPRSVLGVTATVAWHGALLTVAFGAASRADATAGATRRALVTLLLLATAAAGTAVTPAGAVLYLAHALWLLALAARGHLASLGLARPVPLGATALGAALGLALGAHLLVSAALTLGYGLRRDGVGLWLAAVAHDVGANVPSGELFFRGVLFNRLQRRASFSVAASVVTGAWVVRYLVDPRLPASVEAVAGAVVYLTLLGVACCWLYWWSASLVPSLVAVLGFFAVSRAFALR
jgi:hypothetical protein